MAALISSQPGQLSLHPQSFSVPSAFQAAPKSSAFVDNWPDGRRKSLSGCWSKLPHRPHTAPWYSPGTVIWMELTKSYSTVSSKEVWMTMLDPSWLMLISPSFRTRGRFWCSSLTCKEVEKVAVLMLQYKPSDVHKLKLGLKLGYCKIRTFLN